MSMFGRQDPVELMLPYRGMPFLCCERKRAEAAVTCRHWQGDEVRGKRGLRRSGYAKMSFQAEHGTVEGHEPIETHLRVESSPLSSMSSKLSRPLRRGNMLAYGAGASHRARTIQARSPAHRERRSCFVH